MNQIHTATSQVHKSLIEFFKNHPLPAETYTGNKIVIQKMYEADEDLWKAYETAVSAYSNDQTEEQRLDAAKAIGTAAIKIREYSDETKMTIIRNGQASVTIGGLTAAEIMSLRALHTIVTTKMTGGQNTGNAEKAAKMVDDFKSDMEHAKKDNTFPMRWTANNGVWRCVEHEKQKGRILTYTDGDAGVIDREAWKEVVVKFNHYKNDAVAQPGMALANASNKFAVDVYCAAINRYRKTTLEKDRNFPHFYRAMEILAAWLNKTSIKKSEWLTFMASNKAYKAFFDRLDEANTLYDNPGKLTRSRAFACASSLFPAPEPLALFGVSNRMDLIPKMIVQIYDLETRANIIDVRKGTTSTSEHLLDGENMNNVWMLGQSIKMNQTERVSAACQTYQQYSMHGSKRSIHLDFTES